MRSWKLHAAAIVLFAVAAGAFAARASVPVLQIENAPVQSIDGKPLTLEQVRKAVIQAGSSKQWIASQQPNNVIRFSHSRGKITAVVDVAYSTKAYSIRYVDSSALNYEMKDGTAIIHPTFNNWVTYLRNAIDAALRAV